MRLSRFAAFALALGAFPAALAPAANAPSVAAAAPSPATAATGRASVHLVRFLDEVSAADAGRMGPVHDVRLRLVAGNVLLLKHRGAFVALLPFDRRSGAVDSLQYFYYREGPPMLWVLPGSKEKAIRSVADGGEIRFPNSRLIWRDGPDEGWIYFPDIVENAGLKFSVVSGKNVDQADPRDTKYWVELGTPGTSGF